MDNGRPDDRHRTERRIRIGGLLVIVGLVIQLVTILWDHPLAFLTFVFLGGPFVLAGIVVYLTSLPGLMRPARSSPDPKSSELS